MSEVKVNKISPRSGTTVTLGDSGDTFTLASGVSLTGVNATFSGDLTVDTNTLKVDSANNRVGIGTSSPSTELEVNGTITAGSLIAAAATDLKVVSGGNATTNGSNIVFYGGSHATDPNVLKFRYGTTEAMRIDDSGNVLVGMTSASVNNTGFYALGAGGASTTRAGGTPLNVNRQTDDGTIISVRKDGTEVGSIGNVGSYLVIGSGATGLFFDDNQDSVKPRNSNGSARDNAIDLGNSTNRFNDLYLGGNIYLGGTGSANALDDYEEGTWTPVVSDATSGGNNPPNISASGAYTKIGRMVRVSFSLGNIDTTGMTSGNTLYVQGLPFTTSSSSPAQVSDNAVKCDQINFTNYVIASVSTNNTYFHFRDVRDSATDTSLLVSAITNSGGSDIAGSLTYFT